MITDVGGIRVGHWTDAKARTGCTVVLCSEGTVGSVEVRGGAPATRELEALAPGRLVDRVDAVVLTGGSAFGLAAADGVMGFCEERGIGFPTPAGPVPIVPALALYDLAVGDPAVGAGPHEGRSACEAATADLVETGTVGAGTGATVGKWRGPDHVRPGGLVTATVRRDELVVAALLAVNAFGEVDRTGHGLDAVVETGDLSGAFGNTTIGVVATNARLDPTGCLRVAQGGHHGLARSIAPSHTAVDGDALVALAIGAVDASIELVRVMATAVVEQAVRSLPTHQ